MRIYQNEVQDWKTAMDQAAMEMTSSIKEDPDWGNPLHSDAHPLAEYLRTEDWFQRLLNVFPQHEGNMIEECRMQIEAFNGVEDKDLAHLFAVSDRESCCMLDAVEIMKSGKYAWYPNMDIEEIAWNLVNDSAEKWVVDYVDFSRLEKDLWMHDEYTEHDGGVLRRR